MITLKEALKLSKEELAQLKDELRTKSAAYSELNGYIDVEVWVNNLFQCALPVLLNICIKFNETIIMR